MGCTASDLKPQELIEFRKLNTSIENVEIPARPEARTVTDKKGFLMFGIGILLLLPFLIYGLTKSDVRHLSHSTDDCGNFCGRSDNVHIEGVNCSGRDYLYKPYRYKELCSSSCGLDRVPDKKVCVLDTPEYREKQKTEFDVKMALEELRTQGWKFFVSVLITIVLSVLTLVALRYMPGPVVWGLLILSVAISLAITGALWYLFSSTEKNTSTALTVASIWTLFVVILLIILLVLIKKIALIIQLYKEAVKVLAAMPLLIVVTILVIVFQSVILGIFYTTTFYLSVALDLYKNPDKNDSYLYLYSPLTAFTIFLNILITAWVMHFVLGIQYMIISGSVARWFFAKNKDYLESPILTSTKVAMKYHLGTVAFGSFLITMFSIVKGFIKFLCRNVCCRCCFVICCSSVEIIFKFISENSYIQTAIHGQSYCKSANRATKLLLTNVKSVAAINCVGDFLLWMIIFVVTVIATAISCALFLDTTVTEAGSTLAIIVVATLICLIINVIIISITIATFQIIVDTLLLCFCEDSVLNDGVSRPYYMSKDLMQFVQNSKKMYKSN